MTTQQRAFRGTKLILIASALWRGVLGGEKNGPAEHAPPV